MSDVKATSPDHKGPAGQGPDKAVDGKSRTKWWTPVEPNVSLLLEIPEAPPHGKMHFSFLTGDDMPSRDPVHWVLESSDGERWQPLLQQDSASSTPIGRLKDTSSFEVP